MNYQKFFTVSFLAALALAGCADASTSSPSDAVCGNGMIEVGEECDGNAVTCPVGKSGTAVCNACKIDGCVDVSATCGNNQLDAGEDCDGLIFAIGKNVCPSGTTGTPVCNNCQITGCTAAAQCGNNKLETGEACDGQDFGGKTCDSYQGTGATGNLVCNNCQIDASQCVAKEAPATCPNGLIDPDEECEGDNLNGKTCEIAGAGYVGDLKCLTNCTFDKSDCHVAEPSNLCGNGSRDDGEECDGQDFGGKTCETYQGTDANGDLVCNNCQIDASQCVAKETPATCSNGDIDEGEECDGNNLNNQTCEVAGAGYTGDLKCNENCTFDKSGCQAPDLCNDGKRDDGEECDGSDFGDKTCESYQGTGAKGDLSCNNCQIDASQCVAKETPQSCPNNQIDAGEECDGDKVADGFKCEDGYKVAATITCNANCTIDKSKSCIKACNDGILDTGEECDKTKFAPGKDVCPANTTGTPKCNASCQIEGCVASSLSDGTHCVDNILSMCENGECVEISNCTSLGKKCDETKETCIDAASTCSGTTVKITGTNYTYDCKNNKNLDGPDADKVGCSDGVCTDVYCENNKLMLCDKTNGCVVEDDCAVYGSNEVKCSVDKVGCVCSDMVGFCYTENSLTKYALCDTDDIAVDVCQTNACDENGCAVKAEYYCGDNTLTTEIGEECDWQMDGNVKYYMSANASNTPTCNYFDSTKVFVSGTPTCVNKKGVCQISVDECVEASETDYTDVQSWNFTSDIYIQGLTKENKVGAVLLHHSSNNDGFKTSKYVSEENAWQIGSWVKGTNPDFNNYYMWFKVGNAKKKVIRITFDVKRADTGPKQLKLEYYNGSQKVGTSEAFTIEKTYTHATFVAIVTENNNNKDVPIVATDFSFKLSAFDATNEGTMSIKNVVVKSLDSTANNDNWWF